MKLSNFRIRDKNIHKLKLDPLLNPKQQNHQDNSTPLDDHQKFSSFLQSFQNLINSLVPANTQAPNGSFNKTSKLKKIKKDMECRDRFVLVDLPEFQNNKIDLNKLQKWIGEVCMESLSVSFNYFIEKKINYEQMRVFASQSLLRNLSILADTYKLTADEVKFIDKIMEDKILPYLKTKYPLTVQKDVNKALQSVIQEIDNSEVLANDYFSSSDIYFEYRENGRYDDVIMRLLNQIMTTIDMKVLINENNQTTNFKEFESLMSEIFQKPFDESWMNSHNHIKDSKTKLNDKEKEKYRQTVQQYTSYSINRKVSQNTHLYTEDQIKSGYLSVKSATILRILTKWCDELWGKFENENYFMERTDGLGLIKTKKVGLVFPWLKTLLTNKMKQQKKQIETFLQKIEEINYRQQIQLLENELQNNDYPYIEKYEKVSGKFACKIVNNIESFIVVYLNKLIHSLTTVSHQCFKQMKSYVQYWPNPFNLISFKVGDLIRCKYFSKEKQVLRVFKQIQKLSKENSDKIKIIRIKNRLRLGTNDIMINVKLNNLITCEVQLAVNNAKSEFMDCSNKINHYIYQLERSQFGPILQMCSIWKNHEKRSVQFQKLISKEKARKQPLVLQNSQCIKNKKQHQLNAETNPFICSQCSRHYYHNNYIVSHMTCKNCSYWKCAICLVEQNMTNKNKQFFFSDNALKEQFTFLADSSKVPQFGACIFIKRPKIETFVFMKINYNFKDYLVHRIGNEIVNMRQVTSQKQIKQFFSECLVFGLPNIVVKEQLQFDNKTKNNLIIKLFIPDYLKKCFKQEKEAISILKQDLLSQVDVQTIYKDYHQKLKCIKSIQFSSTQLTNLDVLSPEFVNLNRLNINLNHIKELSKITQFIHLQKLYANDNGFEEFPTQIGNLKELKELDAYKNSIKCLPQSFVNLTSLVILNISQNKIEKLPENIYLLENLKSFSAKNNSITLFPVGLTKNKKLETLHLSNNKIQTLPQEIQGLLNLRQLNLSTNVIKQIQLNINKLQNLRIIELSANKFTQIPQSILNMKCLESLNLGSNQICKLPDQITNLQNLSTLILTSNQLTQLNPFKLAFGDNQIEQVQDSFDKLKKLKDVSLQSNKLKKVPSTLSRSQFAQNKNFANNPYQEFSLQYFYEPSYNQLALRGYQNLKKITYTKIPEYKQLFQQIALNHLGLQIFPDFVFNFENIKLLALSFNKLTSLSDNFKVEMKFQNFKVTKNQLSSLPFSLFNVKTIQILYLDLRLATQLIFFPRLSGQRS